MSDRCSAGELEDLSGPGIQALLQAANYCVELYAIVPDEKKIISSLLTRWCDEYAVDVIFTTGGTGFAARDVTPEATASILQKPAPGIAAFLMSKGMESTPYAILSRGVSGIRGSTLIVNLPGSFKGAIASVEQLLPILEHGIEVLRGVTDTHNGNDPRIG